MTTRGRCDRSERLTSDSSTSYCPIEMIASSLAIGRVCSQTHVRRPDAITDEASSPLAATSRSSGTSTEKV